MRANPVPAGGSILHRIMRIELADMVCCPGLLAPMSLQTQIVLKVDCDGLCYGLVVTGLALAFSRSQWSANS
jgi:hypothetical protein